MKRSATLGFVEGGLTINLDGWGEKEGTGCFVFKDEDLQFDKTDPRYRFINIDKSELLEIRDFIISHLGINS